MNHKQNPKQPRKSLAGAIVPTILPLNSAGELDIHSAKAHLNFLLKGGVDGIWMNGTTGEFFALSEDEAAQAVSIAVEHCGGRVPVVAQVGAPSTRGAVLRARRAVEAGADFCSVLLPYYMDYSQIEIQRYLTAVAEAVGSPVLLYQMPQTCKISLKLEGIIELTRQGVLMGMKDSTGSIDGYRSLANRMREEGLRFVLLNGSSMLMDVGLMAGGDGFVSGITNLVPHLCKRLYLSAKGGDWAAAGCLQSQITELVQALRLPDRQGLAATIGAYKSILKELGVIKTDLSFGPFQPFSANEMRYLSEGGLALSRQLCKELLPSGSARSAATA